MKIIARMFGLFFGFMVTIWGIMICFLSRTSNSVLMWMLSITLIISSIGSLFTYGEKKDLGLVDRWTLVSSEASFVLGIILININFLEVTDYSMLKYFLLIWLLVLSVTRIGKSFFVYKINRVINKKTPSTKRWWLTLVFGAILGINAILCCLNIFLSFIPIQLLMGVGLLVSGIDLLVSQFED